MKCSKAKALLSRYLDSELGEAQAREVESHLSMCPACRAQEASLRSALGLLGEWIEAEPRLGFEALLDRVERRRTARRPRPSWPALPVPRWATAALAAATIVGGVVAGTAHRDAVQPAEPATVEQVARAMDFQPYDVVESSLTYSLTDEGQPSAGKGEQQ